MENNSQQFSLRGLLIWVALIAVVLGVFTNVHRQSENVRNEARKHGYKEAYGGRRYTRDEAEKIAGHPVDILPDEEFRAPSD